MIKKHIDVIVKYFTPVAAGIETNVLETYSVLAKLGWDITIHTSTDTLTKKDVLNKTDELRGLRIVRYKYSRFGYFPKIDWENTSLVCLHNFNVSHINVILYSGLLKILGRKKFALIVTPHGGFNPEWSIYPVFMRIAKQTYHYSIGTILINLFVDKMRAVSEWERNEIIKKGVKQEKVITISNGLEQEAYLDVDKNASAEIKEKVKGFGRYLIQIGRVYVIKNYETTIRALPSIPKDVKFIIAGPTQDNDNYLEGLQKLAKDLGVYERVIFMGVIRGIDKYYLIKHAQAMVHMALWESYCNVVHEGLSQGLVCIVANNTALPLLIKDRKNGYLVETRDSKTLADSINYVLSHQNSKDIELIKKNSKDLGLQDSWESVAGRMNILYNKLLKKNNE
jgi:glycosyltransferase involved in cell wall biosynthesis